MFWYLDEFWTKQFSISKIQVLKNTEFGFWQIFQVTKMVQIVWNISWIFLHMFVFQNYNKNLFLWIFKDCMRFYLSQEAKLLIPINPCSGFCRSTGPVDRVRSWSTKSVDYVYRTCTPVWLEGRSTARELLLSGKPRSTGSVDRQRALLSVPGSGRPGWSTDALTVRNLTVGGRPAGQPGSNG